MKTVQKLELCFSIAVLFAIIFQLFSSIFVSENAIMEALFMILTYGVIFLIIPSITIFIGTYVHAVKGNIIGFAVLMVFGTIFLCFWGIFIFFGLLVGPPPKYYIVSITSLMLPSFFVGCTMILAVTNVLSSRKNYVSP
jgi:cation transport ATPase